MKVPIQEINISFSIKKMASTISNLNAIPQQGSPKEYRDLLEIYSENTNSYLHQIDVFNYQKTLEKQTKDWQQKVTNYQDKTKICIKPNQIIFSEPISNKNKIQNANISQTVSSYLNDFPEINYQKVSIDFNSYLNFNSEAELKNFLAKSIFASNISQQISSDKSMTLALKLSFPYDKGTFIFNLEKSNFDEAEKQFYIIWFTGRFDYSLKNNCQTQIIQQKINKYDLYADKFVKFVSDNFSI